MTSPAARMSGLARYREKVAEEKKVRMAELCELRKSAKVEVIEGREFSVVRIPDGYGWSTLKRR